MEEPFLDLGDYNFIFVPVMIGILGNLVLMGVGLAGDEFGVAYHAGHVWKILRALDWSPQRPVGKARERNEERIRTWKRKTWTRIKKKAQNEGRTLVFIDESGLSQKPHRCRTWAPRGQTPVLQFNFNWEKLSVSAG